MTMHASTGVRIEGEAAIAQSIAKILTTPIGTRLMRRDFGSRLADLIDTPLNPRSRILWLAATAGAIRRWEDRVALQRVAVTADANGRTVITITGHRTDLPGKPKISLNLPV